MRFAIIAVTSITILVASESHGIDTDNPSPDQVRAHVEKLIGQLGADEFERREHAQAELQGMGLAAFEALNDATRHDDIEVATRVKSILLHLQRDWARPEDSAEVKRILTSYGDADSVARHSLMNRLAILDDAAGVPALCRIARYETKGLLAEFAALEVMKREVLSDEEKTRIISIIRQDVGASRKPPLLWLHAYAESLIDPKASLEQWGSLVDDELTRIGNAPHPEREKMVSRELLRWDSRLLVSVGERERANAVLERSFDFLTGHREDLVETADMLIEHEAWTLVSKLAKQFAPEFDKHIDLLYRLAEAHQALGENEAAMAVVNKARATNPKNPTLHSSMASSLQRRGLIDWAEAEFRVVIDSNDLISYYSIGARILLSEMLHDHGDDTKASEALAPLVEVMEKDAKVKTQVAEAYPNRDTSEILSRYYYFLSRSELKDQSKLLAHLRNGISADRTDVDVLIAMHRVPNATGAWKKETKERIEFAIAHYRGEIAKFELQASVGNQDESAKRAVAMYSNQLAWLIGNTIGDYDEAIRCSHRSLEIKPDTAAYLDTLGRCYYAKKDFVNAVKYQRQALKADPHSGLLKKQLALFEKALADSRKKKN